MRRALCAGLLGSAALVGCAVPDDAPDSLTEQAATVCAAGATTRGIDVSYYEDSVDWAAVHGAGVDFAFIRVSDGTQFPDPKFAGYWAGARAAGVLRGAYQFFRPAEDPIAQADLLLTTMGPLAAGDLPPVIDVEVSGGLTTAGVAASVKAWVDHVAAAIGRPPIIYAGLYSWHDLTGSADLTTSPLWVAQYTSAPCPDIPTPWPRWLFWQDSSTGSVAGIPGATLDLDVFDGTLDALRSFGIDGGCATVGCTASTATHAPPAADAATRLAVTPLDPPATLATAGCSAGGGGAGLWVVAAALGLRRRRARRARSSTGAPPPVAG